MLCQTKLTVDTTKVESFLGKTTFTGVLCNSKYLSSKKDK